MKLKQIPLCRENLGEEGREGDFRNLLEERLVKTKIRDLFTLRRLNIDFSS
jgi:hypothetical protein